MGMTKWWSKSQRQQNKHESKNSRNLTAEGSNKGNTICNTSVARPSVSRANIANEKLNSLANLEVILKDANISKEDFTPQKLLTKLQGGVFLNQKRQKYWVDKMGKNCFMIYPRDFHITWGHDDRYWSWFDPEETSADDAIEMANLLQVSWLDMSGSFDTTKLSPETLYEASFVVMMKKVETVAWDTPADSVCIQPDWRSRGGQYSFVVMTENKIVWDTPVEEVTNVLLVKKNQRGTETRVAFIPAQLGGRRNNPSFVVMMENEDGTRTPQTITTEISAHKLTFMLTSKFDDGAISIVSFVPTQPDGSGHELSFAETMKNEDGLYTPVTFIHNHEPDGSQNELTFAIMKSNEVLWETPVMVVPNLPNGSMPDPSFVVTVKNEDGLDTLVTFVPRQPDGKFAITMTNDVGWETPVAFELSRPDGTKHERKVKMFDLPKEKWVEIPVGKFRTFPESIGNLRFYMFEHRNQLWKRGLIVKGLKIQAKIA